MIPPPDIPGHTVIGELGSGGFATVYRTWQTAVGRETAVKVDSRALRSERDQRRFFREVTAAGRLSGHPHVIDVYDAGTLRDGRPYMVMELCPGGSLNDALKQNGPMAPAAVAQIGVNLADALAAAHEERVLHRDLKPANILVNRYGVVGIADFGLASIIAAGGEQSVSRDALTPAYAPPESFFGAEPTPAADIYSMGATLYALLAGRPPHFPVTGEQPPMMAILALRTRPVEDIPGVPSRLTDILRACLAPESSQRLPSAARLRDELAALLGGRGAPSREWQVPATPSTSLTSSRSSASGPGAPGMAEVSGADGVPPHAPGSLAGGSGTTAGRSGLGETTQRGRRRPFPALAVGGGVAAAALIVAGVLVVPRLLSPGNSPAGAQAQGATAGARPGGSRPAPIGVLGVATTTRNCPAASVQGAGAACVTTPECWAGINDFAGVITVQSLPCDKPHTWQTFAIAMMPSEVATYNVNIVAANPTVQAVCAKKVAMASRAGDALKVPPDAWSTEVVPPDEDAYNTGVRAYRCLAGHGLEALKSAQFGS